MTRQKAQSLGLKWYSTGKTCKQGHIAERYTLTGHCRECMKRGLSDSPHYKYIRNSVVNLWNKSQPITMRQIGEQLGLTKGIVARLLCEARNRGAYVLAIDAHEGARRSVQARMGA